MHLARGFEYATLYCMIDAGRQEDLEDLMKQYEKASPERRKYLAKVIDKVKHESANVRNMRSALIKAHRSGNIDEIKDTHDFIEKKDKYVR